LGGRDKKRRSFFSSSKEENKKSPNPLYQGGFQGKKSPQPHFTKGGNNGKSPQPSNARGGNNGQSARGGRSGLQLNIYRKISYSFIILTLALLAVIFYFSFVKVTITVVPAQERISNNLIVDIYDEGKNNALSPGAVFGAVERVEIEKTKNYSATGSEIIGEETTGKVVIINNYSKNQPLVATTRLLSADNKLFRLKNTINVPAGGTVEAEVYADEPGQDMAIGPSKFTIPGLWAGLQDKIYAESKEPMQYRQNAKNSITQSDIDAGLRDLRKSLLAAAEKEVGEKYKNYNQIVYKIDENSVGLDIGGKVGEEKEEFSITMTTAVAVAAFNDEAIKKMARDKLASVIASGKKLEEFNEDDITYSLDSHNLNQGAAAVNVSFSGKAVIESGVDIIDREKILGLTREQLNDFLDDEPKIESYEVSFSPAFIDKVPNLADRIKVKVRD
ncbi:MAG: hypothetical protein GWO79_00615, partial [Actinobacteria bacterium]|nr:hypothetical protein [Actinomycetota bacterium]